MSAADQPDGMRRGSTPARFERVQDVAAWLRDWDAYELACEAGIPPDQWSNPIPGEQVREMLSALADAIEGKPPPPVG